MTINKFIPQIPSTVRARFKGYHVAITGDKASCEILANSLFNFGVVTAIEEEESCDGQHRIIGTVYKRGIKSGADTLCAMGYLMTDFEMPRFGWSVRRKRDSRKKISIAKYHEERGLFDMNLANDKGLEAYKAARLPLVREFLNEIKEEIGERAEVVEGSKGRGLAEFAGV